MMVKMAECLLGPFHETFAFVLAIVLFGIALGSWLTERFRLSFGFVLLVGAAGLVWLLGAVDIAAQTYARWYPVAVESYALSILLKFAVLGLLMAVPATAFGATIPALLREDEDVARRSGELLYLSSIANAGGFLLMAFVLHRY